MITNTSSPEDDRTIVLAQWQTCVEMANAISQRRDAMNNIFVTLNLAIIATVSFVWDLKSLFILVAGIVVCILWVIFIRNFKLLNTIKFDIINSMERFLPQAPFTIEWEKLQQVKKYYDGTSLEKILPFTFIILYIVAGCIISAIKLSN